MGALVADVVSHRRGDRGPRTQSAAYGFRGGAHGAARKRSGTRCASEEESSPMLEVPETEDFSQGMK